VKFDIEGLQYKLAFPLIFTSHPSNVTPKLSEFLKTPSSYAILHMTQNVDVIIMDTVYLKRSLIVEYATKHKK